MKIPQIVFRRVPTILPGFDEQNLGEIFNGHITGYNPVITHLSGGENTGIRCSAFKA
jgi:hypothetical protein